MASLLLEKPREDTILDEDQIEQLLQRAEARLRQENALALTNTEAYKPNLPKAPRLSADKLPHPYVDANSQIAKIDAERLVTVHDSASANRIRTVEDPIATKAKKLEEKQATAGPKWFDMPKTNLTPELKRDLQLIKMRGVLDPHRHYKKENAKAPPPPFAQVGTLVEGPTEFFSSRINNKDRKRTIAEEILAGEQESGRFKRKYNDIQEKKTSGKKGYYKAQMAKKYNKSVKR